jgi:acetyl esterase/lipase
MKLWVRFLLFLMLVTATAQAQSGSSEHRVLVDPDGTVHMPAEAVPPSAQLSPAARAYLAEHLHEMQDPQAVLQDNGVSRFMRGMIERDHAIFAVDRHTLELGGVETYEYLPRAGVAAANRHRVLINLHGGGFSGCWPGCAELESIPLAARMRVRVVSVHYREGPEHRFPAASEDVASVYAALLRQYRPHEIGIYGCSAGGMLTAMSVAWFAAHHLPEPGAVGIYCAGVVSFAGDAAFTANPLGEARPAPPPQAKEPMPRLGYLAGTSPNDPLVSPAASDAVLRSFPPTLLLTGTRDFASSSTLAADLALTRVGVPTELHVWDGLFHGFFYNAEIPESQQAFDIMTKFFNQHLER